MSARNLFLSFLILASASSLSAERNRQIRLSQFGHRSWRVQDGALNGSPASFAQTSDGYIWIGTQNELLRFDGVRLARWIPPAGRELPESRIWTLLGSRDGSLWIGTDAGLSHLNNRELVTFPDPVGHVNSIIEKSNGEIWFSLIQHSQPSAAVCQVIG